MFRNGFLCTFVLPHQLGARKKLRSVLAALPFGDWLVLYLVARNIDRSEQIVTEFHYSFGSFNFGVADPKQFDRFSNLDSACGHFRIRFRVSNQYNITDKNCFCNCYFFTKL
jgi:hypothetical protein